MANRKKLPKLSKRAAALEQSIGELIQTSNQHEQDIQSIDNRLNEMDAVVKSVTKKVSLLVNVSAKSSAKTSQMQTAKPAGGSNTLAALTSSMNVIATSLGIINTQLSKITGTKMPGAQQVEAPAPAATPEKPEKDKKEDLGGMLKGLFSNPAVVAAMAGIVYTILPKDMQNNIKAMLGGFADGLKETMGQNEDQGLGAFNTALKGAGIALTTYFGAKMISGVANAITTTLKIVKTIGGGKLGRGAAIIGAGAAVGAAAGAAMMGKDEEEAAGAGVGAGGGAGGAGAGAAGAGAGAMPSATPESRPSPAGTAEPKDKDAKVSMVRRAAGEAGLTNKYAQIALLANIEKESGFKPISENLNYSSSARIKQVFPSAIKKAGLDEAGLQQYVNNPQALAELVYGSKSPLGPSMGNDQPGDGYKYRGRGFIQLTGKKNYAHYGKMLGIDLVGNPDLANDPYIAAKIAAAFVKTGLKGKQDFSSQSEANAAVTQVIGGSQLNLNAGIGAEILGKVNAYASQFGGDGGGSTMVASAPTTGSDINQTSQSVRDAARPGGGTTLASMDNSKKGGTGKQEPGIQAPIPSPIASRGSLGAFTKHSTAYV